MKKELLIAMVALAGPAFAQTTNTDCYRIGDGVHCQSRQMPGAWTAPERNPSSGFESYARGRELALRERELALREQEQREARETSTRATAPAAPSYELISAEAAVIRRAFVDFMQQQYALPESERMNDDNQRGKAIIDAAARMLGRQPRSESIDLAMDQLEAAMSASGKN